MCAHMDCPARIASSLRCATACASDSVLICGCAGGVTAPRRSTGFHRAGPPSSLLLPLPVSLLYSRSLCPPPPPYCCLCMRSDLLEQLANHLVGLRLRRRGVARARAVRVPAPGRAPREAAALAVHTGQRHAAGRLRCSPRGRPALPAWDLRRATPAEKESDVLAAHVLGLQPILQLRVRHLDLRPARPRPRGATAWGRRARAAVLRAAASGGGAGASSAPKEALGAITSPTALGQSQSLSHSRICIVSGPAPAARAPASTPGRGSRGGARGHGGGH